uniref:Ribonuclease n=1 Tax=Dermatophagoides pteronyssinus TaxID=6956 RepID=A0A6P6YGA8_DERPT|nr:ribonuclease H2 subunit A-like [Dermatophagoides pteronyssinus]
MFELKEFFHNPNEIYHLNSAVKQSCQTCNGVIVGIDEAGRGPVLGPMIYTAAYCPILMRAEIEMEKYQDSKTLTEKQRTEMFETIDNDPNIGWSTTILSPIYISNSMLKRSKYNLNSISHDSAINLIQNIQSKGIEIQEVYLDTVGPPEKYQQKLRQLFPDIKKIIVAKKADSLYKIVSIASICAKVLRDYIIKYWQFQERNLSFNEHDYGSGYPSDPKTKEFLQQIFNPIFGFPTFVRFSWSTITKIMDDKAVGCNWDDDEDDDDQENNDGKQQQSIMNFFKNNITKKQRDEEKLKCFKSSNFFQEQNLEQINDLDRIFG